MDANAYDEKAKRILRNKQILANIMLECIPEYANLSKKEIINCIEDGQNDQMYIQGLPTDDTYMDKAEIKYDILFTASLPNSDEKIGMYINLELQNIYNPGYPLIKRAVYYASRLIARQKSNDFVHSEFKKIKKVYTIWICTNPDMQRKDTINYYTLHEECHRGLYHEPEENYKLINIIMLNIGDDYEYYDNKRNILKLLNIIFKDNKIDYKNKRKMLKNEYDIMSPNEETIMSNWGESLVLEGRKQGFQQGRIESTANSIISIMKTFSVPFEKAVECLKVDPSIYNQVANKVKELSKTSH